MIVVALFSVNAVAGVMIEEEPITAESVELSDSNMLVTDDSADAVANYDMSGSVFEQITNLEQEKLLMKLEKERAELDLDLDRLTAEKIKLRMELDELSNRKQQEVTEQAAAQQKALPEKTKEETKVVEEEAKPKEEEFSKRYKLIDIIGAGSQLQSTIQDMETGQRRKVSVGKVINGYTVESISLYDGVEFIKDGKKEVLNIGVTNE